MSMMIHLRRYAAIFCAAAMASASLPAVAETAASPAISAAPSKLQTPDAKTSQGTVAATAPAAVEPAKGTVAKTIDTAKTVVKEAVDILARVPCLPVKGTANLKPSLPRVAKRIAASEPVTIVAFGSSSTAGFGSTSADFTYPNRLAAQLRRKFPNAEINVINRGIGGQDTREMVERIESVIALNPDLVMWQLGTNTVVKGIDMSGTEALVEDGISRLQAQGSDVVLIDPQYVPAVNAKMESASKMVQIIQKVAALKHISVFPRFEVMREWHEEGKMPFESFSIADGLHMNDWGYACFAQLLGDTIIKSVGQVNAGVENPSKILTYRPN